VKIAIATALITLAVIGWRLNDIGPGSGDSDESSTTDVTSAIPDWISFESAIREGETTGRPSMVFIYADWCPWCRKTFRETFTDDRVLQYLKENYQVVKLNTDSSDPAIVMNEQTITEAQLVQVLGAGGLPTYVFLDSEGKPITKTMGFYDAESVLGLLATVAER